MELGVPAGRPAFTVADRCFTWGDVVEAARRRGDLDELERQTRRGLSCRHRSLAARQPLDPAALHSAATAFRYTHDLLAAEELEAWLEARDLTSADWTGYLERLLHRERWADGLEQTTSEYPVTEDEVAAAVHSEAVCSGFLRRAVDRLAEDAALAVVDADGRTIADLTRDGAALRERAPSPAEIEREVASHALDWIRIEADSLELDDAEAAREAALCVRVDGRSLPDVAGDCGVPASRLALYLGDADPQLQATLISASPGELVGPFERDDRYLLLQLRVKAEPRPDDPELERRAGAVLTSRAVERALRERVVWHERP